MKRLGRLSLAAATLATLFGVLARPAYAHEKWFVGEPAGELRWDLFFRPLPLALVGAVLLATLLGGMLWRSRGRGFLPGPEAFGATDRRRSLLYGLVPLILGIHVAVPLLVNGVQGTLFSPDNELPSVWANFLGLGEAGIALALFYGGLTRVAAAALGLLWFSGIFLVGLEPMLENVLYLGFAAFLPAGWARSPLGRPAALPTPGAQSGTLALRRARSPGRGGLEPRHRRLYQEVRERPARLVLPGGVSAELHGPLGRAAHR